MRISFLMSGLLVGALFFSVSGWAQKAKGTPTSDDSPGLINDALTLIRGGKLPTASRDKVLGNIVKNALENHHYTKRKLNAAASKDAFGLYIKRLDYRKRFLLQSDVDELAVYKEKLGDELENGNYDIVQKASTILRKRVKQVEAITDEILKGKIDLTSNDKIETDPDKRQFSKSEDELKALWRQLVKLDIVSRYLEYQEKQDDEKNGKKSKKSKKESSAKKEPPMTLAQMEEKALKETKKSYKTVFKRMLREDHNEEMALLLNAIAMAYDPHTAYMPPREKANFNIDMQGTLEGIGAMLREDEDYIRVVEIVPGSASWKQGELKTDDVILKVAQGDKEAVDIVGMRVEEAVELIRGKKGTEVRLTVKKTDGKVAVIPIVRDTVTIEETYAKSAVIENKDSHTRVGYIYVPKFYRDFSKSLDDETARNCTTDVKRALDQFKKLKIDGVVLDLRNDGGGSLEDARLMSGLFIEKGPIVQVRYNDGRSETLQDTDPSISYGGPLIVLVNTYSASASEIVAGALQDYGRAVIVGGEHTHGKGTVQTLIDLDTGVMGFYSKKDPFGNMKLTISKFYRVSGGSTQYKGIVPDIALPDPYAYAETGERSLEFSLPWDEVGPVSYSKWPKPTWNPADLKQKSLARAAQNAKFKKISDTVKLLSERRKQTVQQLNLEETRKENKGLKEKLEALKYDEDVNSSIVVTFTDKESLSKPSDKKLREEMNKKSDDYAKTLRSDPYIEESLNIIRDMK